MRGFLLITLVAMWMVSCKSGTNTGNNNQTDELIGRWELTEQSDTQDLAKVYKEGLPVLSFENVGKKTMIYGYDGCNRIRTEVKARKNGSIDFDAEKWVSTFMNCDHAADEQFKQAVLSASSYSIDGDYLTLNSEMGELRFFKVALNGKWTLSKLYNTKPKVADLFPYRRPFIQIDINSLEFNGHTACNVINGRVLINANEIEFSQVISTKIYCENSGEKLFVDALNQVSRYELSGNKLLLYNKDKLLIEFEK